MSATRTDVERQAFAERIVALAPGEVEADQVLQRVAAAVRRLQDGET